MIRFEGALTPAIYRRALGVIGGRMRLFAILWIVVGVIGVFSAHREQPATWAVPLFFLLFGVFALMLPRITVRRAFATDRLLFEPIAGEADEQGIRMESAHGRADLPWTLMHKVVVSTNVVTVYQSVQIIRMFPREFFADEESWQAFRRLAAAAPASAKPPLRPIYVVLLWIAIIIVVFVVWEIQRA
jgi:hypothetical protein